MAEGTEVGTAYVSILPSAQGFGAKLEQQITGQAGSAGTKAGQALGAGITGQASGIARGVAGVFAAVGAASFIKGSLREAEEAAKVGRLTESVIRSTGGAAGVTAAQVEKLANSLSTVAGVDDEVIQSAENVMLTFTQISGTVFPAAVKAALDMSAALGTDLQGSVIQLGKALNDPVQGMTALRRVGVSFTEQQVAQVKALQDSGNLLGAQKIVLAEVNREFGGAAAAGATATQRLHVAVGNLEESLGTALLPAANLAAEALTGLVSGFTDLPGPIKATAGALVLFAGAALAVGLIAPKIRAARLELEGLGLAGGRTGAAFGIVSKAGLTLGGIIAGINFADKISGVKGLDKQVAKLAVTTDQELNKAFHGTNNELRGWDLWQAVGLSKRHDEFKTFTKVLEAGNFALAQRIIASETDLDVRNKLQVAYDKAISQTRQLNTDQALSGQIISDTGDATEDASTKAEEAAKKWDDLRGSLEGIIESDWSKQLASNLTSALSPMERFVVGSGKNIDTLKEQVTSAKTELDSATAGLAKFETTGTAAEIGRLRGTAGDIDAARDKVTQATRRFKDANAELAAAQKSPLATITDNLKTNLKTITDWLGNLGKVQEKLGGTAGEELAKHLGSLGPQAADAVAEAVRMKPSDLSNLEGLFDQSDKVIADAASGAFELNMDQAAKPGETLAEIIADRYEKSLTPKFTVATLKALNEATTAILAAEGASGQTQATADASAVHTRGEEREQARSSAAPGPQLGPVAPPPVLAAPITQPLISVPGFTMPTTFNVTTTADPRQIAAEVGDHIAWRLAPSPSLAG